MTDQLLGQKILVTGAATGIGAAAVKVFLGEGATVTATYRETKPTSSDAAAETDGRLTWLSCDFTDKAAATSTVEQAAASMGGLDVLLHAAGRWEGGYPHTVAEDELQRMLTTNVTGTVFANQACYEVMSKGGGGRIINLGSAEGVTGSAHAAAYAVSKAAVHAWTRSAASAWGPVGISVNALAPAMETPGTERYRETIGPEAAAAVAMYLKQLMPVQSATGEGLGDPVQDLGPMMVFLASTGSRFITGQLLAVDGGLRMLGA